MNDNAIGFREQFIKCSEAGHTKGTKFVSFEDHPEMLPAVPSPKMAKAIASGERKGVNLIVCGKFGGVCSTANPQCRQERNAGDAPSLKHVQDFSDSLTTTPQTPPQSSHHPTPEPHTAP